MHGIYGWWIEYVSGISKFHKCESLEQAKQEANLCSAYYGHIKDYKIACLDYRERVNALRLA